MEWKEHWAAASSALGLTCLRPKLSLSLWVLVPSLPSGPWYLHYQENAPSLPHVYCEAEIQFRLGRYAILSREGPSSTRAESRTRTCCSQTALKAQCEGVRRLPRQAQHWPCSPPTTPHQ